MSQRANNALTEHQVAVAAGRPQSAKRKARLGVIGAGWWATANHIPLLAARHDVELTSVCALDGIERIRDDFGFAHATTDYRELLAQGLDGVVIASPHSLHAEHTVTALEAGCHVMVEKPMATRTADARRMVGLARQLGKHLLVPCGYNYLRISLLTKQMVAEGLVGDIEFVTCHMASPLRDFLSGKKLFGSDGAYVKPIPANWADPAISHGGYAQAQLSHVLALLGWVTGLRAKSVLACTFNGRARVDLHDAFTCFFETGAAVVTGSAGLPPGAPFQVDIRLFGSLGMLPLDFERERLDWYSHDGQKRQVPVVAGEGNYHCDLPPHQFVELILGLTEENYSSGELSLGAVEIVDAAYRSASSGREEEV